MKLRYQLRKNPDCTISASTYKQLPSYQQKKYEPYQDDLFEDEADSLLGIAVDGIGLLVESVGNFYDNVVSTDEPDVFEGFGGGSSGGAGASEDY